MTEPAAYRHRIKGTEKWTLCNADDEGMKHAFRYRDVYPDQIEIEPLFLESSNGWQPIDTAPKNGDYILGFDTITAKTFGSSTDGICVLMWVDDEDGEYQPEWQVQPFAEGLDCVISETNLTHWMKLPDPPKADNADR